MPRIINADDFGASKEVNEGVIVAFRSKAIDSASIILGPEKEQAMALARKYKIPCGIHLYKEGSVYSIFLKSMFSKKFRNNLELDFEKQILEIKKNIDIGHTDSHKHIHMFPPIFNIVLGLAKKHNLRLRLSKQIDVSIFYRTGLALFYHINKKKALEEKANIIDSYEKKDEEIDILKKKFSDGEIIVHPKVRMKE